VIKMDELKTKKDAMINHQNHIKVGNKGSDKRPNLL